MLPNNCSSYIVELFVNFDEFVLYMKQYLANNLFNYRTISFQIEK